MAQMFCRFFGDDGKYMGRRNWSMNTCRICSGKRTSCEVCVCVCVFFCFLFFNNKTVWSFQICWFSPPPLGEDFPIWLSSIFQMGWNHQLENIINGWMIMLVLMISQSLMNAALFLALPQGRTDHDFLRGFHERYHRRSRRSGVNHQSA